MRPWMAFFLPCPAVGVSDNDARLIYSTVNYTGWGLHIKSTSRWSCWHTNVCVACALYPVSDGKLWCLSSSSVRHIVITDSMPISCIILSYIGDQARPSTAVHIWNSLFERVTLQSSLAVFRACLKTCLFSLSLPWLQTDSCHFRHFICSFFISFLYPFPPVDTVRAVMVAVLCTTVVHSDTHTHMSSS